MYRKIKDRIYLLLNPAEGNGKWEKAVDYLFVTLIILNIVAVILETVDSLHNMNAAKMVSNVLKPKKEELILCMIITLSLIYCGFEFYVFCGKSGATGQIFKHSCYDVVVCNNINYC